MAFEENRIINKAIFEELAKSSDWVAEMDEEGLAMFIRQGDEDYIVSGCADIDKALPSHMSLAYHCCGISYSDDVLDRVNQFNFDVDTVRACWFDGYDMHGVRFDIHYSLGFLTPDRYIEAIKWGIGQIRQVLDLFLGEGKLFPYE